MVFDIIGSGKPGKSAKGNEYIQITLNQEQFKRVYKEDYHKLFLFKLPSGDYILKAPLKEK